LEIFSLLLPLNIGKIKF